MTSVPLPTVVPQDAWYTLTTGGINPSQNDSVPNASYLSPSGDMDGVIGALDGALIYLAGTTTELDGGQKWLMWVADSQDVADGVNTFNPNADPSALGRWKTADTPISTAGGQIILAGSTVAVLPSSSTLIFVVVNKTVGSATTILLPVVKALWQTFRVIDGKGDAATNTITISGNGSLINGAAQDYIVQDYGATDYTWDGTEFRVKP